MGTTTGTPDILLTITAQRRRRVAELRRASAGEPGGAWAEPSGANPFLATLEGNRGRGIIAEVKMGSPKLGPLVGRFDPEEQARLYAGNGAVALSVVVEPDFFYGSYELLSRCREASALPAIAKDFIVDEVQLRWAREAGAEAVLLIASLYDREELKGWAEKGRRLGLVPLIETHGEEDAAKLDGESWELVGVNNRDLRTFAVDLEHSVALLPRLPTGALKVAESGIHCRADVELLRKAGFDGFLVGESLLLADDPAAKLKELLA